MIAREGLSEETGNVSFLGRSLHIAIAVMTRKAMMSAGIRSFFTPTVTVISFDVMGFLVVTFSAVGIPSSILPRAERSSSDV